MRVALILPATLLAVTPGLIACGDAAAPASGHHASPRFSFDSERIAPRREDLAETGDDTRPDPEDSVIELDLADRGAGVVWIDQTHINRIYFQHSDPQHPDAWTKPKLIFEAGDGCLTLDAATDNGAVAVGAGCYADDAFIQQAPDQGVAVVSPNLDDWASADVGESIPVPEFTKDGVVWTNEVYDDRVDIRWTEQDGFST